MADLKARDDLAALLRRLGWSDPGDAQWDNLLRAMPQIAALASPEDARDAVRYRWLRAQEPCNFCGPGWQIRHHWYAREAKEGGYKDGLFTICLNGRALDDTIDEAIAQAQQQDEKP